MRPDTTLRQVAYGYLRMFDFEMGLREHDRGYLNPANSPDAASSADASSSAHVSDGARVSDASSRKREHESSMFEWMMRKFCMHAVNRRAYEATVDASTEHLLAGYVTEPEPDDILCLGCNRPGTDVECATCHMRFC